MRSGASSNARWEAAARTPPPTEQGPGTALASAGTGPAADGTRVEQVALYRRGEYENMVGFCRRENGYAGRAGYASGGDY